MDRLPVRKIDIYILLWGMIVCSVSAILRDLSIFLGALCGVVLAVSNWFVLRHLGMKMIAPDKGKKARLGIFLALKTSLMLGAVIAVLVLLPVHPVSFVVGISSLILGVLTHSVHQVFSGTETAVKRGS